MFKLFILLVFSTSCFVGTSINNTVPLHSFPEVSSYLEEMENDNYSISSYETLVDFDNNYYTLFQLNPCGYVIFDQETKEMVEGSFEVDSPYQNAKIKGNKYYGGPLNYFVDAGGIFYDIGQDRYFEEKVEFKNHSKSFSESFTNTVSKKSLLVSKDNESITRDTNIGINTVSINGWTMIDNYKYFENLNDYPENNNGSCGFVALSILLSYFDCYYHGDIVSDNYIIKKQYGSDNKPNMSPGPNRELRDKLLYVYGDVIPWPTGHPTMGTLLESTYIDYSQLEISYNVRSKIISGSGLFFNTHDEPRNYINQNYPAIIVMTSYNYSIYEDGETHNDSMHIVVAYGYKNEKFKVHYGLGDERFNKIIINSAVIQSYMGLKYNGVHSHNSNYFNDDYFGCSCGVFMICRHYSGLYYNFTVTHHTKKCFKCGEVIVEKHQFVDDGLGWMICKLCKYRTNVSINRIGESVILNGN